MGSFIARPTVCSRDGTHTHAHKPAKQSSRGRSWWPGVVLRRKKKVSGWVSTKQGTLGECVLQ